MRFGKIKQQAHKNAASRTQYEKDSSKSPLSESGETGSYSSQEGILEKRTVEKTSESFSGHLRPNCVINKTTKIIKTIKDSNIINLLHPVGLYVTYYSTIGK